MYKNLLAVLLIVTTKLYAQPFGVLKQGEIAIGGIKDTSYAVAVIQSRDGGYAIAGYTSAFGAGGWDVYVVKLDYQGNLQWTRTIGGKGNDQGAGIVQTPDGGFVVGGTTTSFGAGASDIYAIKLDSLGNVKWTRTIGTSAVESCSSVAQSKDGGVVLAGGTDGFGTGYMDFYAVKLDMNGNLKWSKAIGGTLNESATSITASSDGGFAMTGITQSFDTAAIYRPYVVKIDSSGTLQWANYYSGLSNVISMYSIIQSGNNGYSFTGTSSGGVGTDSYVIHVDAIGNFKWELSGIEFYIVETVAYAIAPYKNGGYLVATAGQDWDATTWTMSVSQIDSTGKILGSSGISTSSYVGADRSVVATKDGGYAITYSEDSIGGNSGYSMCLLKVDSTNNSCVSLYSPGTGSRGVIDTGVVAYIGGTESNGGSITSIDSGRIGSGGVLTDVCTVLSVNNITSDNAGINVYPNPSSGKFNFVIAREAKQSKYFIEVYSMLGEKVASIQWPAPNSYIQIDLSNQPEGLYLYRITSESGEMTGTGKLIIE